MRKILLVFLLFLLKVSNTNAQSIDTDFATQTDSILSDKPKFVQQIEAFQIKKEKTLSKRRSKSKNKRKSKIGIIYINFAEHNFRVFTC